METNNVNKKTFYFNSVTSDIIVYDNFDSKKINIGDFVKTYDCTLEREFNMDESKIKKYKVNSDLYIDSLNTDGKLITSKIEYIMHKEGSSNNIIYDVEYNNDVCSVSNLAIYDKKKSKIIISPLSNIDQKFVVQNVGKFSGDGLVVYNYVDLNIKTGFLVGYWLSRGWYRKLEKDSEEEYTCFKGKEEDLSFIGDIINQEFQTSTVIKRKNNYKNFEFLILINNEFQEFITEKFENKRIPSWVLKTCDEFIIGLLFSFIYNRSYLSKDKNNNSYLVVSNKNKELLEDLQYILKSKFSLNSKFISTNESLSFKINEKLVEFLKFGIDNKLFNIDFDDITVGKTKEFYIKGSENFKIIPWYKMKVNKNENVENSYTLKLDNSKIFMLANGLFVLS